eukprot:gene5924-9754_t
MSDPFDVIKEEVQEKENYVNQYYGKWKTVVKEKGNSSEIEWLVQEMKEKMDEIELDLEDLKETIEIVEKNPLKFQGIVTSEMNSERKKYISDLEKHIKKIRSALSPTGSKKINQGFSTSPRSKYEKLDEELTLQNQLYIDNELKTQEDIKKHHDESLEEVSIYIDQLHHKAELFDDEMDKQNTMLNTLSENAAKAKGLLKRANQQINRLLSASDKGKIICIIILIIIVIGIVGAIFLIN